MTDNAAIVFHGFLNLSTLEKKSLVDAMNVETRYKRGLHLLRLSARYLK
jgi:hypothetical protein